MATLNLVYSDYKTKERDPDYLCHPKHIRQCFQCKELYDETNYGVDHKYNICTEQCFRDWFHQEIDELDYSEITHYSDDCYPDCA